MNLCSKVLGNVANGAVQPAASDMRALAYFIKFLASEANKASHFQNDLTVVPAGSAHR